MKNLTKKLNLRFLLLLLTFIGPTISLAQSLSLEDSTFGSLIMDAVDVLNLLKPILFTVAFIVFFWGLSQVILHSDNPAELENGRKYMLWGIIALFVLMTFMAIIALMAGEFEFGNPVIPRLPV